MNNLRSEFEKDFPIPAHWIEWNDQLFRYDCHVGLADSTCIRYNLMFDVWCKQQKKIEEIDKHFQSLISESELWGFGSDQATRQAELIQELLK